MPALINTLLSTPDNVAVVRDQVAAILKLEIANQAVLGLTPEPRVFRERSNPWEMATGKAPIVNVYFDNASFDAAGSNIVERQKCEATFNIDAYAFAESKATVQGHTAGDELAASRCLEALGLCRKILMSGHYTYLGLQGLVWKRWTQTLGLFRPPTDDNAAQNTVAGRLALVVTFNEFSPQVAGEVLETLSVEVRRAENGELYLGARYESTPSP
jgi:hypothetical protein